MKYYQITDAAKKLNVETHVLRYWEEELELPIERNKQGHRLYTEEDLERFSYIMNMKREGLKLRAIRMKVHGSSAEELFETGKTEQKQAMVGSIPEQKQMPAKSIVPESKQTTAKNATQESKQMAAKGAAPESKQMAAKGAAPESKQMAAKNAAPESKQKAIRSAAPEQTADKSLTDQKHAAVRVLPEQKMDISAQDAKEEKAVQLCMMLQQMVGQAVRQENEAMAKNMKKEVADVVAKEMNYQFRMQEDRDEEHFRQLDELLRSKCVKQRRFHRKKVK